MTFQQDNARLHVARVVRDYLTQQNVDVLPWPAVSSDLSPIEHVWGEMELPLRHLQNQSVTLAEMGPALICVWNNIPQVFFNALIRPMRRRCQACINAHFQGPFDNNYRVNLLCFRDNNGLESYMLFAISCKGFVHFEFLILINQVLYTF